MEHTQHELKVPAEHVAHFRAAVAREIANDADRLKELVSSWEEDEIPTASAQLNRTVDLFRQLPAENDLEADLEVRSDRDTLAQCAEEMARRIVEPKLADELLIGPMEGATEIDPLLASLRWAVDHAVELHATYARERGWKVAA